MLKELPGNVAELMRSGAIAEYATISAPGVPIGTPVLYFPSEDSRSFDLATGLAYPAKAERARRNPEVGLLIEGGRNEPVISIAGMAAVRDSDLQANVDRYLSEAGHTLPGNPDWSLAREAVWYWTRIIVEVTPARVLWWDTSTAMDGPPHRWDAPAGTVFPKSDPAPPGAPSSAPHWKQPRWQELATQALARGGGGHLSFIDGEGYPLPIGARTIIRTEAGFTMQVPKGVPWFPTGKGSLSFQGLETFLGEVETRDGLTHLRVDRVLPIFPMTNDPKELWEPSPETYDKLMARLRRETKRRRVPIPTIPLERPPPTESYARRMARAKVNLTNTNQ